MREQGDRNIFGGDRAIADRGYGGNRGGDRSYTAAGAGSRYTGAVGVNGNFQIANTTETYLTLPSGINLRASISTPNDGKPNRRVLIAVHGGGFATGTAQVNVAQDAGKWGFLGVAIEVRLAPPHVEMNTPTHPSPGQNTVGDSGFYPAQLNDLQACIRHYRADSRCNGEVVVVGGSSGAYDTLMMAATGTKGDDRPDLALLLSTGVSSLFDPNMWVLVCAGGGTCPHSAVANWLNITDTFPLAPTGADLALATTASPISFLNPNMCPIWFTCATIDGIGIPNSVGYNIHGYQSNGTQAALESGANGLLPALLAKGIPESFTAWAEPGSFKQWLVPVSSYSHSFGHWDNIKSQTLPWLSGTIPP